MKKSKVLVTILAILAGTGVAIQFIPVSRTNPPVSSDLTAPAEVKAILRTSCYDCHSNETVWPWYSHVAPVSWLVASDTAEGRSHFNFSNWNSYPPQKQGRILAHALREIQRGDMPPWYYTIKHRDARLTPAQRATLEAWVAAHPQP
jgi:hypothetical protein